MVQQMKSIIKTLSKTSIIKACLFSVVCAYVSNVVFNLTGEMVFSGETVNITNNVIDSLQLLSFVIIQWMRYKRFTRYDLPFLIGGGVALFA